ncbi:prenyltransferase/squalene oxidase repeat-containing protein [Candidatus Viridilinea mediisalina]|uniref:Squalene cyclase C-terminal domain-containing protein n=1 Tax=Candidatus Viridilinea mediisalina TaxID=2024553 RepID=A0A2A6RL84_9CHLR|nr:prenyltransferase/squalene oxidase repeat-containing protein [Candidatus Viridilinea mediisalina]PDW03874.1 hypothetical protein CJ255_06375 [Candidatus Viridilinea mediisalina]
MDYELDILLTDLRHTITQLGKDGGLITPAVYDTAQVLRWAPPTEGVWPAISWLLAQQHDDGGWGDPATPRTRDLPTLAAILALHTYCTRRQEQEALRRGLTFLSRQASYWQNTLSDDLTAGIELLLPMLIQQAQQQGLDVDPSPYQALIELGERRRQLIQKLRPGRGTTALHSWEAWGNEPDPALLDADGSIGSSLAATAYWLHLAGTDPTTLQARESARNYIQRASQATGLAIPGVVPSCWPCHRFEQVFALHTLYLGGLLTLPQLADSVKPQLDELERIFTSTGISHNDCFAPDGDDTAAAIAIFHTMGYPIDCTALMHFAAGDHFCAWHHELQPSVSVTAHAIDTLRLMGQDFSPYLAFLLRNQLSDGRWPGDKWNRSWLYTTWRVLVALGDAYPQQTEQAINIILAYQQNDGGWGIGASSSEETAYALLALRNVVGNGKAYDNINASIARGERWLQYHYRPLVHEPVACWLTKETFRPKRIAHIIELTALLSSYPAGLKQGNCS